MRKFLLASAVALSIPGVLLAQQATAEPTSSAETQGNSPRELQSRLVARRAIDAVIWGVPAVSLDMMRQAYFRDGQAHYNDIIWWPKGSGWKNQSLATNTVVRYIYFFANTKNDGPVVFELPPATEGAGFYGTLMDAWQVPLADVGTGGKGGKYLILPPGYTGEVPSGYTVLRPKTYNTYTLVRSILASNSEADVSRGDALVKQIRVYPLSKVSSPPAQRFKDMTDILYQPAVPYDASFYVSLARVINEEPVNPMDLQVLGMLLPLGIEKGKAFAPDSATRKVLDAAAREAHAWLLDGIARVTMPWWPGEHWGLPSAPVGVKTTFLWEVPEYFDVDGRGITLADWFGPVAVLGKASAYLATFFDNTGAPLQGQHTYRLHVPANVPVREFWSITPYDMETSALFFNSPQLEVSSMNKSLQKNPDGSVDVYFGPKAPAGKESNWVYTAAGKQWFPWFRFYGPTESLADKSWKMADIEKVK
jgi:hypothetical protein